MNKNQNTVKKSLDVSVIVPFFNIEECVSYCLDSLIDQEFNSYEIICVDDGSTDKTATLLDEYEKRSELITVIHVPNGGLSSARNIGIRHARAKLVTFVDGDDIVSPYYLSSLYEVFERANCDVVVGSFRKLNAALFPFEQLEWMKPQNYLLMTCSDAVDAMLYEKPMIASWAHLCSREVYEKSPFLEGRLFEDSLSFKTHIAWAKKIAIIEEPIYGYVNREGSITSLTEVSNEKILQFESMLRLFSDDILSLEGDHSRALTYHLALESSRFARMLSCKTGSKSKLKKIRHYVRSNLKTLLRDENVSLASKIRFVLFSTSMPIYFALFNWYDSYHNGLRKS